MENMEVFRGSMLTKERLETFLPVGVPFIDKESGGGVVVARSVAKQRAGSNGGVGAARGVADECA